jgi:K+-sensing histidine kinase KdpD
MLVPVSTNLSLVENHLNSRFNEIDNTLMPKIDDTRNSLDILTITLRILLSPTSIVPDELSSISSLQALVHWFSQRRLSSHPPIRFSCLYEQPVPLSNLQAAFTVLWNLLHNAAKHSKEGAEAIQVTLSRNQENEVVLSICNEGEMLLQNREKLCGHIVPASGEHYKGLPITAQKIVDAGWQLVDVTVGFGTTVRIKAQ